MTALPRAIAPWAEHLALFPPDLAVELGGLVQRLALAIGPLRARDGHGHEEPDGFSGLTRRGSYERLLTSEWLLAEEAPEEFLRRAAMREHAFFDLSHRSPSGSRRSVALFDAGPSQLGAPRIAHLALLIVLARRALAARVEFAWGVLQDDAVTLETALDPTGFNRLLAARTARSPGETHLSRWAERLGKLTAEDDLWLIGGEPIAGPATASRVIVEDPLAPGERRLEVKVAPARRAARSVSLVLPSAPAAVRLLRDPFAVVRPGPADALSARPVEVRFDPSGHRLIVLTAAGLATVYPVPNSPRASPGKPRAVSFPPEEQLVAVGAFRKSLLALCWTQEWPNRLAFRGGQQLLGNGEQRFDVLEAPFVRSPLPQPVLMLKPLYAPPALAFLDGGGTLFVRKMDEQVARPVAHAVTAMTAVHDGLVAVSDSYGAGQPGRRVLRLEARSGLWDLVPGVELPRGDGDLRAHFGVGDAPQLGGLGVRCHQDRWKVFTRSGNIDLVPPTGAEVVGVMKGSLLLLEEERTVLSLMGLGSSRRILQSSSPLLQVTASAGAEDVACINSRGEVIVHSVRHDAELLRLTPESP